MLEREELALIEPDPLCFVVAGQFRGATLLVFEQLKQGEGLTKEQLLVRTNIPERTIEFALTQLTEAQAITKTTTRPVVYTLRS